MMTRNWNLILIVLAVLGYTAYKKGMLNNLQCKLKKSFAEPAPPAPAPRVRKYSNRPVSAPLRRRTTTSTPKKREDSFVKLEDIQEVDSDDVDDDADELEAVEDVASPSVIEIVDDLANEQD